MRRYQNQGITLPQPASTPEPGTSGMSNYSADEDDMSYTSSVYEDLLPAPTQGSTPKTHHSWAVEEPFPRWTSQDSFSVTCTAPDFTQINQPHATSINHGTHWSWTTTATGQPPAMHMTPSNAYANFSNAASLPPYDTYGAPSTMLGHTSPRYPSTTARVPTSSPRSKASIAPPYQDPQAMTRFMRYGVQRDPPFQY